MNKIEIEQALRDYHWMVREIERLRSYLSGYGEGIVRPMDGLPKPKGQTSDPVYMEVARRERQWKRMKQLEEKVRFIQERIHLITEERERTVLDCLLDGLSIVAIARHMRLSRKHIQRIKDSIVDKMAESEAMVR